MLRCQVVESIHTNDEGLSPGAFCSIATRAQALESCAQ